jgi:sugar/nucleoside kinase (ribokinase family)
VGSGDIFGASFAYRYQQSQDLIKSVKFANKISRKCLFYTPDEIKLDV